MGGVDLQLHPFLNSEAALRPILKDDGLRGPRIPSAGCGGDSLSYPCSQSNSSYSAVQPAVLSPYLPICRMDIRQFILTSYLRWGCYRHLRRWPSTQQRPVQTQAHANTYQQWRHAHTVPFYGQLIFPAGTKDSSLLHSIPTQPNSYSLGFFLMDNTAREWSWPLTPSRLKVKNVWSHTSTLSRAFMAWRLLTNRKKFTFPIPNITVAEQKGSTVFLLLSRKQNVKNWS